MKIWYPPCVSQILIENQGDSEDYWPVVQKCWSITVNFLFYLKHTLDLKLTWHLKILIILYWRICFFILSYRDFQDCTEDLKNFFKLTIIHIHSHVYMHVFVLSVCAHACVYRLTYYLLSPLLFLCTWAWCWPLRLNDLGFVIGEDCFLS